jgi:hypothetical protein
VVFKGNFSEGGISLTGVFYRDLLAANGLSPTVQIARAGDPIPGAAGALFGSTAPPSAANGNAFFVGSDIEEAPTAGGVYRAPLVPSPTLETLVAIGDPVPGEPPGPEAVFTRFGEGLSVSSDGLEVAFWGTWGSRVVTHTLVCPEDGEQNLIAYCLQQHPNGFQVEVPVHQGLFVYDLVDHTLSRAVATGEDGFTDFVYWTFSGRPPGVGGGGGGGEVGGDESAEPPRWRSSSFVSVDGSGSTYQIAFKGHRGLDDGIYLGGARTTGERLPVKRLLEVGSPASDLDPQAPAGAVVTTLGLEREGYRGGQLAVNASMLYTGSTDEETVGWAGVYLARLPDSP